MIYTAIGVIVQNNTKYQLSILNRRRWQIVSILISLAKYVDI